MVSQEELEPSFQAIQERYGLRIDAQGKAIIVQLINLLESETTEQWRKQRDVDLSVYYTGAIAQFPQFAPLVAKTAKDYDNLTYEDITGWVRNNTGYIDRQILACFPGVEPGENPFYSF